jgi:8-oxo-dGTP pyrophosphatase MutT (NUDIX family)
MAAIRETREETGVILGTADLPPLSALQFFARAITPPDRPRRYDTRFFIADAAHATQTALAGDGELSEIAWVTLAEMHDLDLPRITRLIGEDITALLANSLAPSSGIPFYQHGTGQMERGWI